MSPVHIGEDGASIIIEDESFELPPAAAEWFAAQPDPEEAFRRALKTGAEAKIRGGYLEFDAETQYGNGHPNVKLRMVPVATEGVLTPEQAAILGLKQVGWDS